MLRWSGGFIYFGLDIIASDIESDLRDNPVIAEHIGSIQSFELDLGGSFVEEEDEETFVFRIRGSKASGIVTVICDDASAEITHVVSGTLAVDSGETYDLFPEEPGPESARESEPESESESEPESESESES